MFRHLLLTLSAVLVLASTTLGTASTASSVTSAGVTCAAPTSTFNGATYCPATIAGIKGTAYGTGTRVVLKGVTVTAVRTGTVTVAAWALPPCSPGKYCGAILTLHTLTVSWTAKTQPRYGDVLNLYGTTIPASLTPVGYVTTGNCPIEWC